jgi:hypothetical protein
MSTKCLRSYTNEPINIYVCFIDIGAIVNHNWSYFLFIKLLSISMKLQLHLPFIENIIDADNALILYMSSMYIQIRTPFLAIYL